MSESTQNKYHKRHFNMELVTGNCFPKWQGAEWVKGNSGIPQQEQLLSREEAGITRAQKLRVRVPQS